ncbi:hypothetical protein SAMN04515678_11415 [Roseivivax sediminis]|uniref:Uncharacterized protein n=1 Tax=Roseivivax sediminis TaxID=936889 RepID=A0A1I2CNN4_9RHOB|nr:hypothetical protein SAMN04515678_11415 [Roseivivax sediminis]
MSPEVQVGLVGIAIPVATLIAVKLMVWHDERSKRD